MHTFKEKVLGIVAKIPKGKTMTYSEVAQRAGSAGAARAVGTIMKGNYDPKIPCHRVIPANAILSGRRSVLYAGEYNRGRTKKLALLRAEGAIK